MGIQPTAFSISGQTAAPVSHTAAVVPPFAVKGARGFPLACCFRLATDFCKRGRANEKGGGGRYIGQSGAISASGSDAPQARHFSHQLFNLPYRGSAPGSHST